MSQPVTLTDLGELDAPETYPAKGALCLQVARSKSIGTDGGTSYLYEEAYLPVVVAEDHSVYGELDTLAGLLGMNVQYFDSTALVTFFETDVYLALGDPQAGYTTPLFRVMAGMGRAPVLLDQMWYVPLDEFLSLTGTVQKYGGDKLARQTAARPDPAPEDGAGRYRRFLPGRLFPVRVQLCEGPRLHRRAGGGACRTGLRDPVRGGRRFP